MLRSAKRLAREALCMRVMLPIVAITPILLMIGDEKTYSITQWSVLLLATCVAIYGAFRYHLLYTVVVRGQNDKERATIVADLLQHGSIAQYDFLLGVRVLVPYNYGIYRIPGEERLAVATVCCDMSELEALHRASVNRQGGQGESGRFGSPPRGGGSE